jgi:hypothetical protein
MGKPLAYRRSRSLRARLLAIAALCALAATYLTPLINADWNAWRYDHGHASLTAVGAHSHPWAEEERGLATQPSEGEGSLVFTSTDDSTPGITAIWRTAPLAAPVIYSLFEIEEPVPAPSAHELSPPAPPPPRTVLSHI